MRIKWQKYQGVIKFSPQCQERIYSKSDTLKRFYIVFWFYDTANWYLEVFWFGFFAYLLLWFLRQKGRILTLFMFTTPKLSFSPLPGLGHPDKGLETGIFVVCGLSEPVNRKPPTILLARVMWSFSQPGPHLCMIYMQSYNSSKKWSSLQ